MQAVDAKIQQARVNPGTSTAVAESGPHYSKTLLGSKAAQKCVLRSSFK